MLLLACPIFGFAFAKSIISLFKKNFTQKEKGVIFFLLLLLFPVILFCISRYFHPSYRNRYMLLVAFAYPILLAYGASLIKNKIGQKLIIGLLVIFSLSGVIRNYQVNLFSFPCREAIRYIEEDRTAGKSALVLIIPWVWPDIFRYYYQGEKKIISRLFFPPAGINYEEYWRKSFRKIKEDIASSSKIYLITRACEWEKSFVEICTQELGDGWEIKEIKKIGGKNKLTIRTYKCLINKIF
jgi:hypothetical protein